MKRILLLLTLLAGFSGGYGQSQFILTFTGVDSTSQNIIPIDSLYVKNTDQQCDTMLYGPYPVFHVTANWPVGISDPGTRSNDAFILKQNYPNPFQGTTHITVIKPHDGPMTLALLDGSGKKLAEYQNEIEQGSHLFEVTSTGSNVLFLVVSDNRDLRMVKIVSIGQTGGGNTIRYIGPATEVEKSKAMAPEVGGFIFYLGDELMYTAYSTGYMDKTLFDSPVGNTNYVFEMVPEYTDVIPTVTTAPVTNITQTAATSGGDVTSDGGAPVTQRGVCWSTSPNPTTSDSHTLDGSGTGTFVSYIYGLNPGTLYYLRAYATNSVGTGYGNQRVFSTLPNSGLPSVTTTAVSNISQTSATGGGNVTSNGGSFVTARGVCWSTAPSPTTANSHTLDGVGLGPFTSYLSGLTPNTLYYVRAYATNSAGTAYGGELSFITLWPGTPTVMTAEPLPVSASTAISGGDVLSDGGTPVTARGVCWSTSINPTTANNFTNDGTGTGNFISNLTGLTPNTTYYVRAYATNSQGTAYGTQMMFNNTYWIGESYGGGIIFSIDDTWQHGIISSATDQSAAAPWGCPGILIGGTGYYLGMGQSNTTAIVNGCSTPGIAARICDLLVLNGYDDWFLPSLDELYLMQARQTYIGGFVPNAPYWSSSEFDQDGAAATSFPWGDGEWTPKSTLGHVRAIRVF